MDLTEKTTEWSSVTEGIKLLVLAFGVWMFHKQVRPYLETKEGKGEFKSKRIEIPVSGGAPQHLVKCQG